MKNYLETYKSYIQLSCSGRTIECYSRIVERFIYAVGNPEEANYSQVLIFINSHNSISAKKQAQGALMHFYKGVVHKPGLIVRLPKIKEPQKLPEILTEAQVLALIASYKNLKHKAIISLLYYCGLRISELTNLQVKNVNGANRTIHIRFSKGAKHRIVPFPLETLLLLRQYYKKYRPASYLFAGQGKPRYNATSIRKILKNGLQKINIHKNVTPHCLRHSRATHLLANGVDIKIVKEFLGHKKIETTERYLHLETSHIQNSIELADQKIQTYLKAV